MHPCCLLDKYQSQSMRVNMCFLRKKSQRFKCYVHSPKHTYMYSTCLSRVRVIFQQWSYYRYFVGAEMTVCIITGLVQTRENDLGGHLRTSRVLLKLKQSKLVVCPLIISCFVNVCVLSFHCQQCKDVKVEGVCTYLSKFWRENKSRG